MAGAETWPIVAASAVTALATLGATWLANWSQDRQRRQQFEIERIAALQGRVMNSMLHAGRLRRVASNAMIDGLAKGFAIEFDETVSELVDELRAGTLTYFPQLHPTFDKYEAAVRAFSTKTAEAIRAGDTAKVKLAGAQLAGLARDLAIDVHKELTQQAIELGNSKR